MCGWRRDRQTEEGRKVRIEKNEKSVEPSLDDTRHLQQLKHNEEEMEGSRGAWSLVALLLWIRPDNVLLQDTHPLGCFNFTNMSGFMYRAVKPVSGTSVTACLDECQSKLMRYAGLANGNECFCNDTLSGTLSDSCTKMCSTDPSQFCGGEGVISVYPTGHGILGAPVSLTQINSQPDSLHITWEPPAEGLSEILEYQVTAIPVYTYSTTDYPRPLTWQFSGNSRKALLTGIQPGTKYNVSVKAMSAKGLGYAQTSEMWTKVGKPEIPATPQLISRTPTTITVQLQSVPPTNGPVTAYQVVVIDETVTVELQPELLDTYAAAQMQELPYYITAQFLPDNFMSTFTVGNGKQYGRYHNAPLKEGIDYHIILGVLSTLNETKSSYSPSVHEQHESSVLDYNTFPRDNVVETQTSIQLAKNRKVILGLSIAIGVFGFLLIVSIVVYIGMRVVVKKYRRSSENQELAIHAQQPNQDTENGYAVGGHFVDEDTPPTDHYRRLKEKMWIIPHQGLNIVGDIGTGKFGDVRKGVVMDKGNQRSVLVQRIEDDTLGGSRKTQMLREFDAHIRIGSHLNVVSIVGLMEEFNVISLAFEYETATLKNHLVESRAVQHYPVYAEKNRRFSTLSESQAIDILVGVTRGMAHLASHGVTHGQLCARNVVIVDGTRPKVTGFGLIHYHNDLYVPEYKRWHAVETLRSKLSSPKSDAWSFGCLMWEVSTLGGTPYADVRTEEVAGRVMRGLRLPQPQYVGDELYQLMLNCWQHDPDERPSFIDLETDLQQLVCDDVSPYLLFSLYPSFQYEQYTPHLEFVE
ncbi:hypothetical protein Pcinc_011562 [Petrolisthes cinctipes]|uniref:Tyrosine-protein kinase Wsck n=1 Tax=Petrolisthes cinctipes TaxID=88211 RepID=A0AAE1G3E4_PETCI|nr:hypothetical protein Pcinc_011562 [Petrolisthes cinctipes]